MSNLSLLDFKSISQSCVKCGKCIPSCTIYKEVREESNSPRGFLDLLGAYKRGDLELDRNAKAIFESCFLCTTCVSVCPNTLPTDSAIEMARIDIAEKYGIAWYKRAYFYLLRHRAVADFVFSFVYYISPCAFKKDGNRWRSVLPIAFRRKFVSKDKREDKKSLAKRSVFPFARKSFLNSHKECISSSNPRICENLAHNKVAIFIGCISNYNYTEVGSAILKILDRLGIEAMIPKKQECCAAPAFFTGDIKSVIYLIEKNIAYFESFFDSIDAMIVPEATCAGMILEDWERAIEISKIDASKKADLSARLHKLLPKIHMASKWLDTQTPLAKILESKGKKDIKVTYHDPCHARKVLKVWKEPRHLLGNYTIKEMSDSSACCGFGGVSMQSSNYDLSLGVGVAKAHMIEESRADIVSAECGACAMQINNSLDEIGAKTKFVHPLVLVAEQLR